MKHIATYLLALVCLMSCNKDNAPDPTHDLGSHIKYFGFVLIDTYWDDPTDAEPKTNYADEIYGFSNLADILIINPTDAIHRRVRTFNKLDMKAVLHLNELFFDIAGTNNQSGTDYDLRLDYEDRWNQFVKVNQVVLHQNNIGAFM